MEKKINYGEFIMENGELIYCKHCNFNSAVLWITQEISLPLTVFEDIKKRDVNKIKFVNTNLKDTLNPFWLFSFDEIDKTKREKKMFQETQYYFSIKNKLVRIPKS